MDNLVGQVFLTRQQVEELHDEAIELYGGMAGIKNAALLDSAVEAPRQTCDGNFLYPSIHAMAACYLFCLACNHCFHDGNKRVAARAVSVFYLLHGFVLTVEEDEWVEFVVSVVVQKPARKMIVAFLEERVSRSPPEDGGC